MMKYTVIYEQGPASWGPTFPIFLALSLSVSRVTRWSA